MKIKTGQTNSGIVLVVTLATVVIIAILLTGYLMLGNQINSATARSQGWNQAIPVLESGIEEGLTQLHLEGTNALLLTNNGWTFGADSLYHKSRTFSDGSYFNASLQPAVNPIIISTGWVQVVSFSPFSSSTNYVSREVKVVAEKPGLGFGGLNAKGSITFNGSGTMLDSFDSSNPLYSTNGQYIFSKHKANAQAVSDTGSVSVGTGTIYGSATTGPNGSVTYNGGGTVGDLSWVASNSGIQSGHSANDANVQINDVSAPFTYGSGSGVNSGIYFYGLPVTNYTYALFGGNYNATSLSMSGGKNMVIAGNVTLYISGTVNITGGSYIYIAPGASLTLYVGGSCTISGGGVANATGYANNFAIDGLPGCTTVKYTGSASFIGTVNAPEADFTLGGGSTLVGAVTASTITIGGGSQIHYDEQVANIGNNYVVQSWNEF